MFGLLGLRDQTPKGTVSYYDFHQFSHQGLPRLITFGFRRMYQIHPNVHCPRYRKYQPRCILTLKVNLDTRQKINVSFIMSSRANFFLHAYGNTWVLQFVMTQRRVARVSTLFLLIRNTSLVLFINKNKKYSKPSQENGFMRRKLSH